MKRRNRVFIFLLLVATLTVTLPSLDVAYAQDSTQDSQVGFSVKAILPENQIDQQVSYFDLRVAPKQEQDLVVQITNEGDQDIVVNVGAVSASTNRNGIIDYTTPDIVDDTLKIPFSEIATVETTTVKIAAGASEQAVIHIAMPEDEYDGVVLGGLVFTKQDDSGTETDDGSQTLTSGVVIKNVYNYVLGVKLTETDATVSPDFEAVEATPELTNYKVGITNYIRNKTAAIAQDVDIDVEVYSENENKIVKTAHTADIDMAPNSVIPYAVLWDGEIDPGKYVSHVTVTLDGKEWDFDMPFEVSAAEASTINAGSVETTTTSSNTTPWWVILLIILLAVLIFLMLLLLFLHLRKKRKHEKDDGQISAEAPNQDEADEKVKTTGHKEE